MFFQIRQHHASIARLLIAATCLLPGAAYTAPPTTFGTQIGHALLCLDQLNSNSFYDYLKTFYGPPYKKADGAYWFATKDTFLWGMRVSEVMVGDLTSQVEFIGAVVETTPEKLTEAVTKASGIHYQALEKTRYPLRESKPGSRIIYANNKSKIYCAKSKTLLNPSDVPMQYLPKTPRLLDAR